MSVLQISLIVLAVLAVAGVGFYNWLQERKYRQQWATTFGRGPQQVVRDPVDGELAEAQEDDWSEPRLVEPVADGLNEVRPDSRAFVSEVESDTGGHHTPSFDSGWHGKQAIRDVDDAPRQSRAGQHTGSVQAVQDAFVVESTMTAGADATSTTTSTITSTATSTATPGLVRQTNPRVLDDRIADLPSAPVDALLDFVISLHTLEVMPSTAFTEMMEHWRKEHHAARWLAYQHETDKWVEISPWRHQQFSDVVVAVQLADRQGAVSEGLLQGLIEQLRELATRFDGIVRWEDLAPALLRAARIDQFCLEVDVLIGLNVVAEDARIFSGADINRLAEAAGMVLDETGVYQRLNERGDVLYTLRNHEDTPFVQEQMANLVTHGVTLLFEVPRIENGVAVFADMTQLAHQMAQALGGRLVDDAIRSLSAAGIEKIQTQLVRRYQLMEAFDVPAGSRRALRLFN